MSVIQNIRDKYARISVIAIAVALLGFILMDAFTGKAGLFSKSQDNTLGKVNGTGIDRVEFDKKIKDQENVAVQQGYQLTDDQRQQMQQGLWDQQVTDIIMQDEYKKLGLTITDKELRDILYGANPPQFINQAFTDPTTKKFDAVAAQQQITKLLKSGTQEQKDYITKQIEDAKNQRLMGKYMAMLVNTNYFPKWFLEKRNVDNSLLAKISYVQVPYTSIPDSAIKVSDDEIKSYMKEHESDFQQKEETRAISYLLFSAAPTATDSAATKADVEKLKPQFATTNDAKSFVAQQNSALPFFDGFVAKSELQVPAKDSIIALSKGAVYGPYLDVNQNNNTALYSLAKLLDTKTLPDTVKCRHILIGTVDRQGQPLMPDSIAKIKADSIALAIKNGASFDLLDSLYSTDEAAKKEKGVMTFSSMQIQNEGFAKEFGQFILFDGKQGDKKVVKTQFGWHYIEIMEQKNVQSHYKVAYVAKQIVPSNETIQNATNEATVFAGNSRDPKLFNENADKLKAKGINKLAATDLTDMSYNIQGVPGNAHSFIKKIFEAGKGEVLTPEPIGDNYIVAMVTEINEPGLQNVNKARPMIEPLLRNKKKAEQIIKNIGQVTTLEDVAAKTKQTVQTADSIRFSGGTLGYEPKILGAVFNPANKGKASPPIDGQSGVFVIKVENVTTTPVETASIEQQQKMLEQQTKQGLMSQMQQGNNPITEVLKKAADIKDNRAKFY